MLPNLVLRSCLQSYSIPLGFPPEGRAVVFSSLSSPYCQVQSNTNEQLWRLTRTAIPDSAKPSSGFTSKDMISEITLRLKNESTKASHTFNFSRWCVSTISTIQWQSFLTCWFRRDQSVDSFVLISSRPLAKSQVILYPIAKVRHSRLFFACFL